MKTARKKKIHSHFQIYIYIHTHPLTVLVCCCCYYFRFYFSLLHSCYFILFFIDFSARFFVPVHAFFPYITIYSNMIHSYNKKPKSIYPSHPMSAFIAVPRYIINIYNVLYIYTHNSQLNAVCKCVYNTHTLF